MRHVLASSKRCTQVLSGRRIASRFRAFNAPPRTVQFMRENSSWNSEPLFLKTAMEGVDGTFDIEKEQGFKVNDTVFGGEILVERSLTNVDIFYLIKLQSY